MVQIRRMRFISSAFGGSVSGRARSRSGRRAADVGAGFSRTEGSQCEGEWEVDKGLWYSQCLALLESTPHAIVALVGGLPPALLQATDGPGRWNARQVLEHLVWCEVDDWMPRVRLILAEQDRVAFTPFDREGGAKRYADWSLDRLGAEFLRLRAESLGTLR